MAVKCSSRRLRLRQARLEQTNPGTRHVTGLGDKYKTALLIGATGVYVTVVGIEAHLTTGKV